MSSGRTNPSIDLRKLGELNDLIIPPPKDYQYFQDVHLHPFNFDSIEHSIVNAWWLAEFSVLAYEDKAKVADELNKLNSIRFVWLDESDESDTEGYFVEFEDFAVVAFRGTDFPKISLSIDPGRIDSFLGDLRTDITVTNDADIRGTQVHGGINGAFNKVEKEVYELLEITPKQVWFTGHSLGGALAIVSAFKWENDTRVGGVFTYGGPAIGNHEFKEKYDQELGHKTFRYVYGNDFVTNIAKLSRYINSITNFEHVGHPKSLSRPQRWYESLPRILRIPFFWGMNLTGLDLSGLDLIDHGPIFYVNALWNQTMEQLEKET